MNKIKLFLLFGIAILGMSSCGSGSQPDPNINKKDSTTTTITPPANLGLVTGVYTNGDQESAEGGAYLTLEIMEDSKLRFELNINEGAPSYHSGTASGIANIVGNTAIWKTSEYTKNPCEITFTFGENKIIVNQGAGVGIDCGLGAGLSVSGEYLKQKNKEEFPHQKEISEALKDVLNKIDGTYDVQSEVNQKSQLVIKRIKDNQIKVKYTIDGDKKIEAEIPLEQNVALFKAKKDGKTCYVSFTFLANSLIEVKKEQGDASILGIEGKQTLNIVLAKTNDATDF